jgi:hypothetical protein
MVRRKIVRQYQDPLDVIWIDAARQMGMKVVRTDAVFASWDGCGTLSIGTPETLDPDDCVAQMVLHETCHALCEWPEGLKQPDWGLQSDNRAHRVREHSCLRLQAALSDEYGLRQFFAATTVFRRYYDSIPAMALADDGDPAVPVARAAMECLRNGPWQEPLSHALQQTARIAEIVRPSASADSLWATR